MSWGGWDTNIRAIATVFPRKQLKKERKSRSEKIRIVKGFTMEVQCLTNRNSKKQELEKNKGQEFIKEYKTSDVGSIWWLT